MTDATAIGSLQGRSVFVTGASGFIGRRLVPALLKAGAKVTVLMRARHGAKALEDAGAKVVVGGLDDRARLAAALQGQDVLFHLAYDVRASAAGNLAAFDTLLAAASQARVGRIVHTSSIVVYDGWPTQDIDETSPMERPGGSPYRQAKIEMERRLMAGPLPAAIIQPTLVYGPGSALWTDQLAESVSNGTLVLPKPEGLCNAVFVDDVMQAMLRAATLPDLAQERFIVSGATPVSWSALLNGYAAIIGKGTLRHVPLAELTARLGPPPPEHDDSAGPSAAARVSAVARRVLGRERFEGLVRALKRQLARGKGGDTYPDHHLLELYAATGTCSIAQARARLGYHPDFTLEKGLAATADHLRQRLR